MLPGFRSLTSVNSGARAAAARWIEGGCSTSADHRRTSGASPSSADRAPLRSRVGEDLRRLELSPKDPLIVKFCSLLRPYVA